MTVHAVEIICSKNQKSNPGSVPKPEPPDLHGVAHDRVKDHIKYNFTRVLEDQDSPMGLRTAGEFTSYSVDHTFGRYRFDSSDDKKGLLDSIVSKVVTDAKWFQVRYHVCEHDEPNNVRTGCDRFVVERQKGDIPEGLEGVVEHNAGDNVQFSEEVK